MKRLLNFLILTTLTAAAFGQVVNNSLGRAFTGIFPELREGYIDLNRNSRKDESGELNEVIPESRVKDDTIQVQEILDFLRINYRYIPLAKLEQSYQSLRDAEGPIGELISLSYTGTMADILDKKRAIGDQLFLTPTAYKEAMDRMNGYIANMNRAYQQEGQSLEESYLSSREDLLGMVSEGYPFPEDLSSGEVLVLENSMIALLSRSQRYSDDQIRSAMKLLSHLGTETAVPHIEPIIAQEDLFENSIAALGNIGGDSAREILVTQLNSVGSARSVITVLGALGQVAQEDSLEDMLRFLNPEDGSAPLPELEKAALKALADMSARGISDNRIQKVFESYLKSTNPELRMGAIKGLGSLQGPKAEELLLPLLKTERDEQVVIETIKALNKGNGRTTIQTFLGLLRSQDLAPPVRREIIASLGATQQGVAAVPFIANDLASPDPSIHQAASEALVNLYDHNSQSVTATLTRGLLTNEDPAYRERASRILAQLADEASVATLVQMLDKPERQVKENATWALYKIGPENNLRLLTGLKNIVTSEAEALTVRVNAVRSLGKIGMDNPQLNLWQTLMTAAKMRGDKYYMLKYYAIQALGDLGDTREEIVDLLTQIAARDRDGEIRNMALVSLGKLGTTAPGTEEALETLFKKENSEETRIRILLTLSDMDSPVTTALAGELLTDQTSLSARKKLIYALSRMGTREALLLCLEGAKAEDIRSYTALILADANPTVMEPLVAQRLKGETHQGVLELLEELQAAFNAGF